MEIIKAPDFSGGATILYDAEEMKKIYLTGLGSFKMQAKYHYDEKNNSIGLPQKTINEIKTTKTR